MTCCRSSARFAFPLGFLVILGLAFPVRSHAQTNLPLYDDQLESGWQNWSWASVDLASTTYVHTGSCSIKVVIASSGQALYLEHSAMDTTLYTALTFWINGGTAGAQNLQVLALVNGLTQPAVLLNSYATGGAVAAGAWRQVTIPLADLGAANTASLTGLYVQGASGSTQPAFWMDDIALVAAPAPAAVNVGVNASQTIRVVDERVFGVNAVTWDPQTAAPQTIALLQDAGIRAIRIPGGSASDGYNWASPGNQAGGGWGFNDFSRLISGINAQAFVTVNYGSGTQREAAAWVAYANASATLQGTAADVLLGVDSYSADWKTAGYWSALRAAAPLAVDDGLNYLRLNHPAPFALKYWEIGNECYGSWETDYHVPQWDPVTYAAVAENYIAWMKAVDPTIKIGVVAEVGEDSLDSKSPVYDVENPVTGQMHDGWTPNLLTNLWSAGVMPDFLIYHRYDQAPGGESDALLLQSALTWPDDAADLRRQLTDYLGSAGARIELCVTENNSVYGNPGKQTTSLVNGLFLADSICNVLQTEFNSLLWWDLRNGEDNSENNSASLYGWRMYGDYGILSTPSGSSAWGESTYFDGYPAYYVMKLLSHFARGGDKVVQAGSDSRLVSAFAIQRSDGSLSLLVINKSAVNTLTTNFSLAGFVPQATATVYSYGIPQDTAARTGSGSPDIAVSSQTLPGSSFSLSLPPYSATVLTITAAGAPSVAPPQEQGVTTGQTATFTVTADGNPDPDFSWQASADGGSTWTDLSNDGAYSGVKTPTLAVSNAGADLNGYEYRCVVSNSVGTVASSGAALKVMDGQALVQALYQDVLGRPADAGGLGSFEAALAAGSPPAAVLGDLLGSAEYTAWQVEPVIRLYYAALSRMPDYAGLQAWSVALHAGALTLDQAADQFAGSAEFALRYGSLDNTQFVEQLYLDVLNRQADTAGLDAWVKQLNDGASRGTVLVGFSESDEFKADMADQVEIVRLFFLLEQRMPTAAEMQAWTAYLNGDGQTETLLAQAFPYGLSDTDYVQAVFQGFLCRAADAGALDAFSAGLAAGTVTHGSLVDAIMGSAEFNAYVAPVARLYLAAFQRVPDEPGLINWVNYMRAGNTLDAIGDAFAASQEFTNRYGTLSDTDFVTQLYQNVLGRAPDSAGLQYWTHLLATGTTRGQVLVGFSQSQEGIGLFMPTLRTFLSYEAFFNAAPTQQNLDFWTQDLTTLTDQFSATLLDNLAVGG